MLDLIERLAHSRPAFLAAYFSGLECGLPKIVALVRALIASW